MVITVFSSFVKQFDLRWLIMQICCEGKHCRACCL